MSLEIRVTLPRDRTKLGELSVYGADGLVILGPGVPALGCSDEEFATLNGNPTRNPLKRGGDTPYGSYSVKVDRFTPPVSETNFHSYGAYGVLQLTPVSGDALMAAGNGRSGICLHGGVPNPAYTQWQGMRPTHGCVRAFDATVLTLMTEIAANSDDNVICNVIPTS